MSQKNIHFRNLYRIQFYAIRKNYYFLNRSESLKNISVLLKQNEFSAKTAQPNGLKFNMHNLCRVSGVILTFMKSGYINSITTIVKSIPLHQDQCEKNYKNILIMIYP